MAPDGTRVFGEGHRARGTTSVPRSALGEEPLSQEYDNTEQSDPMQRASWAAVDGLEMESDKAEEVDSTSRRASSVGASYGGPHPEPSEPPPVPALPSLVFGHTTTITTEFLAARTQRQEEDGGVRITGGRPGEDVQADVDTETKSLQTLPPPYSNDV